MPSDVGSVPNVTKNRSFSQIKDPEGVPVRRFSPLSVQSVATRTAFQYKTAVAAVSSQTV